MDPMTRPELTPDKEGLRETRTRDFAMRSRHAPARRIVDHHRIAKGILAVHAAARMLLPITQCGSSGACLFSLSPTCSPRAPRHPTTRGARTPQLHVRPTATARPVFSAATTSAQVALRLAHANCSHPAEYLAAPVRMRCSAAAMDERRTLAAVRTRRPSLSRLCTKSSSRPPTHLPPSRCLPGRAVVQ